MNFEDITIGMSVQIIDNNLEDYMNREYIVEMIEEKSKNVGIRLKCKDTFIVKHKSGGTGYYSHGQTFSVGYPSVYPYITYDIDNIEQNLNKLINKYK